MFSKSALVRTWILLFALAAPLCVEGSELTSGSVERPGFWFSRIALQRPRFNYNGTFYSSAWYSTPCFPCYPGDVVNTSNGVSLHPADFNSASVTMGSQTYYSWSYFYPDPPFPYAKFSSGINFQGGLVEVPHSDVPDLILVTPFTMSGGVFGYSGSQSLFSDTFTGSGLVRLHLKRDERESKLAYTFYDITYEIATGLDIDVKPGDDLNYINVKSRGKTPIAILSTASFDAGTVDPITITVAGASVSLRRNGTTASSLEDVNGDGLVDLVVHVDTQDLQLIDPNQVFLECYTFSGEYLWGTDKIILLP